MRVLAILVIALFALWVADPSSNECSKKSVSTADGVCQANG